MNIAWTSTALVISSYGGQESIATAADAIGAPDNRSSGFVISYGDISNLGSLGLLATIRFN